MNNSKSSTDKYNIMDNLHRLETDQHRLDEIAHLEIMLKDAKKKYVSDYKNMTEKVVSPVVGKLKDNSRIKKVVDNYLDTYVLTDKRNNAEIELYNIMAAEFLGTLEALSQTQCSVM
jgi:hypothetical protein